MKVLGVSGSPIANSNTDRALRLALASTGLETEFIKLKDYLPSMTYVGVVSQMLGIEMEELRKPLNSNWMPTPLSLRRLFAEDDKQVDGSLAQFSTTR